jgi:hypothetical protein
MLEGALPLLDWEPPQMVGSPVNPSPPMAPMHVDGRLGRFWQVLFEFRSKASHWLVKPSGVKPPQMRTFEKPLKTKLWHTVKKVICIILCI